MKTIKAWVEEKIENEDDLFGDENEKPKVEE